MTSRNLLAALSYFALVMGTGFVLGCIRVPFLVPRIGERYAELLEMPFMLLAILFAARSVVGRFGLTRLAIRLQVGFVALVLSVAAELMLAAALQGVPVARYVASRDPVSGSAYLVMLTLFALMPAIVGRRRSVHERPPE